MSVRVGRRPSDSTDLTDKRRSRSILVLRSARLAYCTRLRAVREVCRSSRILLRDYAARSVHVREGMSLLPGAGVRTAVSPIAWWASSDFYRPFAVGFQQRSYEPVEHWYARVVDSEYSGPRSGVQVNERLFFHGTDDVGVAMLGVRGCRP